MSRLSHLAATSKKRMGIARNAYGAHNYGFAMMILKDIVNKTSPGMTRDRELEFASQMEEGDTYEAFRLLGAWAQMAIEDIEYADEDGYQTNLFHEVRDQ